jgi:hypothetical protein
MEMIPLFRQQTKPSIHTAIRIIFFIMMFCLIFPIGVFTMYHFGLVSVNRTTLSEMKREADVEKGIAEEQNVYDVGWYRNCNQVFGKKWWQWVLPINGTRTCDGMNWPKNTPYFTE